MSKEILLTSEQSQKLYSWIEEKKKEKVVLLVPASTPIKPDDIYSGRIDSNDILGLSLINGDPLVIYWRKNAPNERTLWCSKKRLKELKQAGIVESSKPKPKK
jgi:hypothetical protein